MVLFTGLGLGLVVVGAEFLSVSATSTRAQMLIDAAIVSVSSALSVTTRDLAGGSGVTGGVVSVVSVVIT